MTSASTATNHMRLLRISSYELTTNQNRELVERIPQSACKQQANQEHQSTTALE